MRGKKGTAPAAAGAVPAVLAGEILELRESVSAHQLCIRREIAEQNRKISELASYWTRRRIGVLLGVTESWISQVVRKVRVMDEAREHTASFTYRLGDDEANAPLVEHMRTGDEKHRQLHARWEAGDTIGDVGDLHEVAHGLLGSEEDLVAALEFDGANDRKGVCPSCGRTYVLTGLLGTTVRRHALKGPPYMVCTGSGATVVPGDGVGG